jgi:hypothetical protein
MAYCLIYTWLTEHIKEEKCVVHQLGNSEKRDSQASPRGTYHPQVRVKYVRHEVHGVYHGE